MTGNNRMAVMDYAKQETRSQGKVNILTFSVVSKKSRKSDPDFQYFDYFFDSTKATDKDGDLSVDILASAWTAFLQQSEKQGLPLPERLFVWSDRGSKDFMNEKVVYMFSKLSKFWNLHILYSTFEAKHGHSICDGHFGLAKKKLRRDINFESSSRAFTKDWVMEKFEQLSNTFLYQIHVHKGPRPVGITIKPFPVQVYRFFEYKDGRTLANTFTHADV